jgi:hypothetical protein
MKKKPTTYIDENPGPGFEQARIVWQGKAG